MRVEKACEQTLEHIYAFISNKGDLTTEQATHIRGHLQICRQCYSRFEFERRLVEKFKESSQCFCPDSLKQKIKNIIEQF